MSSMGTMTENDKNWVYDLDISEAVWLRTAETEEAVEIAFLDRGAVAMRNSTDRDTVLRYTPEEWTAFVSGAKDGEFALTAGQ